MEASAASRRGIDSGRIVVAIGAVILLVALFLDWYGAGRGFESDAISAWTAFEITDLLLALLALVAIASVIEPFVARTSRLPEAVGAAAGPAALVLVIVSIINKPPIVQALDVELEVGAWLALAGAAIMCAGALLALNRVSLVVTPREHHTRATSNRPSAPVGDRTPPPAGDARGEETRAAETETRRI